MLLLHSEFASSFKYLSENADRSSNPNPTDKQSQLKSQTGKDLVTTNVKEII